MVQHGPRSLSALRGANTHEAETDTPVRNRRGVHGRRGDNKGVLNLWNEIIVPPLRLPVQTRQRWLADLVTTFGRSKS